MPAWIPARNGGGLKIEKRENACKRKEEEKEKRRRKKKEEDK